MLVWHQESKGALVSLSAVGRMTDFDCRVMLPRLIETIEREGTLRLIIDLTEFDGWEWRGSYDESCFGIKHWPSLAKIAFIGTKGWAHLDARIAAKLAPAEVRFFPEGDRAEALAWAKDA
jgi:hypothetical protein